jgi:hypothetical protein
VQLFPVLAHLTLPEIVTELAPAWIAALQTAMSEAVAIVQLVVARLSGDTGPVASSGLPEHAAASSPQDKRTQPMERG